MKNVKFASISDQLINTVIIMDTMFNAEVIVKDMKGGKEDMTEKRFVYYEHKGADYILDTPNKSLDFIEMLGDCLEAEEIVDLLNKLHEENERLKKYNNKLMKQPLLFDVQTIPNTMEIMEANNKLEEENKQLKSTIAQLIEQNRKNNDLLLSDIRILEKALWCSGCENDYGRLKELRKEFMR